MISCHLNNQFLLCFRHFELGVLFHTSLASVLPLIHIEYRDTALLAN